MMGYDQNWLGPVLGMSIFGAWLGVFLVPLLIWGIFWKGWALWKAARDDSKVWFVVLMLINTIGILDILYIFWFSKKPEKYVSLSSKKLSRRK